VRGPDDLAARDSATVGGMIATNAGGLRVLRYGDVRAQVNGIEAVLADGMVVSRLSRLRKDSGGYDLPGLLVGSEGTLAVVTRAVWGLVPATPARVVALVGLGSVDEALDLLDTVRRRVPSLSAAETFGAAELSLVRAHRGLGPPLRTEHPRYLLLEAAGASDPTDELADGLAAAAEVSDVAVGERLWAYREHITEAISAAGIPHKLDVAVPLDRLGAFVEELPRVVAPSARLFVFGHLAEGNLHVNVLDPSPGDEDAVLCLVAGYGGAISAEHGVGVAKASRLPLTRTAADIAMQRALKAAVDPAGLLNPGVLFS
jgi:FAD/FMN-containing dehydrogenase